MYLNRKLSQLEIYTSKAIALEAKKNTGISNLSFGEPEFGPPKFVLETIKNKGLTLDTFLKSVKRYEEPKGSLSLRKVIANWYYEKYELSIDPETEIMITHGGVEAITLAILCVSEESQSIAITDPSYMLYKRTIETLGRQVSIIERETAEHEYQNCFYKKNNLNLLKSARAMIINSPENPTGYILSNLDWQSLVSEIYETKCWLIHDEVYDSMVFDRKHIPAYLQSGLRDRSIMINSCSKKFGMPGMRIGWMIASKKTIDLASKIHDYMYLGVNIQYEKIAELLFTEPSINEWLRFNSKVLKKRSVIAQEYLLPNNGFLWSRKPYGAMFLFPDVSELYKIIKESGYPVRESVSETVVNYLLNIAGVAAVPGKVYGVASDAYIRMVSCTEQSTFEEAMQKFKNIRRSHNA